MAYSYPSDYDGLSADILAEAPREFQKAVMRKWFFEHYENPVESTPYDSEEGGYVYIWGGPYDAGEELGAEFSGTVPQDVIDELVSELTDEAVEWSGIPEYEPPDDYLIDASQANEHPRETAENGLERIEALLNIEIPSEHTLQMCRLLYVNAITCLEVYLCDTVLRKVLGDEGHKKRLVEALPEFAEANMRVSDIYKRLQNLDKELRGRLLSMLWHNLERVKRLYERVFEIEWPEASRLSEAIRNRHDIVHRNGKTKEGEEVLLDKDKVEQLLTLIREFIHSIEERLMPPF